MKLLTMALVFRDAARRNSRSSMTDRPVTDQVSARYLKRDVFRLSVYRTFCPSVNCPKSLSCEIECPTPGLCPRTRSARDYCPGHHKSVCLRIDTGIASSSPSVSGIG